MSNTKHNKYSYFQMVTELWTNFCSHHYASVVKLNMKNCCNFSLIPTIYGNANIYGNTWHVFLSQTIF